MGTILEVQDLVKDFGGLRAVNRCSFAVQQGMITGLIGPNGAGKTTVFNLITGFYRPDSGRIIFNEEEITGLPPHRVFHKKVCRTFQIPREFGEMTVLENLMLVPPGQLGERLWGPLFLPWQVRRQETAIWDKALEILEFVELAELKNEYAQTLSGGQKKLLELARTMMADPQLVLLDEPGAGVNPTLMKRLVGSIKQLCEDKGVTFFLIEHDMNL
ncbi:MAG: ABC transporter ATP-binding protein, partial [Thermoplasmata archaeon]|nr:ABC transporter ATP-binding protein [Thermoplasmata archaeon]NIY06414.1 ATP-binding cassette domain-containing protein [Thermoplasmata archaeon]